MWNQRGKKKTNRLSRTESSSASSESEEMASSKTSNRYTTKDIDQYLANNLNASYKSESKIEVDEISIMRLIDLKITPCINSNDFIPGECIISCDSDEINHSVTSIRESGVFIWSPYLIIIMLLAVASNMDIILGFEPNEEYLWNVTVKLCHWIVLQGGICIWTLEDFHRACMSFDFMLFQKIRIVGYKSLINDKDHEIYEQLVNDIHIHHIDAYNLTNYLSLFLPSFKLTSQFGSINITKLKQEVVLIKRAKYQGSVEVTLLQKIHEWQNDPLNYIKYWHMPFPTLDPSNITLAIDCIKTYAICFDLMENYNDVYHDSSKIDNEFTYKGKVVTPDFINTRVSPSRPIEYKCTLGVWDKSSIEKFSAESQSLYGESCVMRFKSLSQSAISRDPVLKHRSGILLMRTAIDFIFKSMNKSQLIKILDNEGVDQTNYLLKILKDHMEGDSSYKPLLGELDDEFQSYDDYLTDFCFNIPKMELFMNSKHLRSEDMYDSIPDHIKKPSNVGIFADHPWDRDLNKSKSGLPIGRRAVWLLSAPFMFQMEELTANDAIMLSNLTNDSNWFEISKLLTLNSKLKPIQQELKPLFLEKAFYKREANHELRIAKAKELGTTLLGIDDAISDQIKQILLSASIKSDQIIKVSKHGKMVINTEGSLFAKAGINAKKLKDKKKKKGIYEDFSNIKTDMEFGDYFTSIVEDFKTFATDLVTLDIPDVMGAFTNETREKLSRTIYEEIVPVIHECIQSPGFSILYRHQHHLQTLLATVPRILTKGDSNKEVTVVQCPVSGVGIFATPAPNELVSGSLVYFGKVKSSKWTESTRIPWVGPIEIIRHEEYVYFYSKPTRENWQTAQESLAVLWGMLSHAVTTALINQPIHHDLLYWSSGWKFSRQIKFAYDLLYIYDKNVYQYGTFGKDDLISKFDGFDCKDTRAMTIFYRLWKNHSNFCKLGYASTSLSTLDQLSGIKHPVYDSTLTGWYGSQMICYVKQELPKVDGADPVNLMGGFAKSDMKYETWYLESEFHPSKTNPFKNMSLDTFYDKVLIKDGTDWTNFAYHPGVIYRSSEIMTKVVMDDKHHDFRSDWRVPSINTGKASKVNVPLAHNKVAGMSKIMNDISGKHATYKGLQSMDLTEALMTEHKVVKEGVKLLNEGEGSIFKWAEEGLKDVKFKGKQLSLSELSLLQTAIYPKCVVVTMNLKDQRDYGKRAFFVQLVYNRNANRLWDYASRPILLHGSNPSDLILVPGMEKYLKMQEKMESIGVQQGNMGVAKDQTKFGDTYAIEAMGLKLIAWRDINYITEEEFTFLWYLKDALANRIVLLPSNYVSKLEKIESKMDKAGDLIRIEGDKYVLELRDPKFATLLNDKRKQSILNETFNLQDVGMNRGFMRANGGVLGVFNVDWSFFSSADTQFKELVCDKLFVTRVSRSDTHSDDGRDYTTLPVPTISNFQNLVFHLIFPKILKLDPLTNKRMITGKLGSQNGKLTIFYKDGVIEETPFSDDYLSKIFLTITCFVPRLFSQRPSLLKLTYGIATEMLQVVCSSSRQIYVPWVRYTAAIAAEMPGRSPANDLQSAVGRVYDMLVNAAPISVVSANMLLINMAIGERFGIHPSNRSVNEPLEMNGIFWVTPDLLLTSGASANMARLLANSMSDKELKRKLALLLNTTGVWIGKTDINKTKTNIDVADDIAKEITTVVDNEIGDLMSSAPTVLKDFFIVLNRAKKTAIGFEKMLEINKDTFDEYVKGNLTSREKFDLLEKELSVANMINTTSLVQKVVGTLSKYLRASYAATRIRNSPDALWVDRWGYIKRILPDPFSPSAKLFMINNKGKERLPVVTIESIHEDIRFLSVSDFPMPELNMIGIDVLTNFYSDVIKEIMYRDLTHTVIIREGSYEDIKAEYVKLKIPDYLVMNPKYIIFSLMILYDRMIQPTTPDINRWVYQLEPSLIGNRVFEDSITAVSRYVNQFGIKKPEELQRHQRLIVSMFSPMLFHGVAKIPMINLINPAYDYLSEWFTWGKKLFLPNIRNLIHAPTILIHTPIKGTVPTNTLCRPLLITLWLRQIAEITERIEYQMFTSTRQIPIDIDLVISNHFISFFPGPQWASDLFTLLLWERDRTGMTIDMRRYHKGSTSICYLKFGRWKTVMVFGNHDSSGSFVDNKFRIYSSLSGIIPTSNNLAYTRGVASMLTYVCLKNKLAFKSVTQIEGITATRIPVVVRFDNELRVRMDIPDKIPCVAVFLDMSDLELDTLIKDYTLLKGINQHASITFSSKNYDYVVTPWVISNYPSDITVMSISDNESHFVLQDSQATGTQVESKTIYMISYLDNTEMLYNIESIKKISVMMPMKSWFDKNVTTTRDAIDFIIKLEMRYGVYFPILYEFLFGSSNLISPINMSSKLRSEVKILDLDALAVIKSQFLMAEVSKLTASAAIVLGIGDKDIRNLVEGISLTTSIINSIKAGETFIGETKIPNGSSGLYVKFNFIMHDDGSFEDITNAVGIMMITRWDRNVISHTMNNDGSNSLWFKTLDQTGIRPLMEKLNNHVSDIGDLRSIEINIAAINIGGDSTDIPDNYSLSLKYLYGDFYEDLANTLLGSPSENVEFNIPIYQVEEEIKTNIQLDVMMAILNSHPSLSKIIDLVQLASDCIKYRWISPSESWKFRFAFDKSVLFCIKDIVQEMMNEEFYIIDYLFDYLEGI